MLQPMTCHRSILVSRGALAPCCCLSRNARRAVARGEDPRKGGSLGLRRIVEVYIRFGILGQ